MTRALIPGLLTAQLFLGAGPATSGAAPVDYADSRYADAWLRHPVYGDPSFDSFTHSAQNPLHRGAPPFEWPVNSFLFADPISGHWYVYVGDYPKGYVSSPSRCVLLRSTDRGQTWSNLGVVLQGDPALYDGGGSTPDVSVVYAEGRYHMVFDWCTPDWQVGGGLGYAWADKPEGPFHRAPTPITDNHKLTHLLGKYQRTYAATLVRRKQDWMIVAMMDRAPNSWALFGITAPKPEGPYSERILLRHVEQDGFHPPLMEFYPTFVHEGYLYAPATSVALNRDFNALLRAPLERAHDPSAWEVYRNGGTWHSDPVEHEAYGIWGQTFSGWVDPKGVLQVAFQSRDPQGMGTVNIASRPWKQPLRKSGFVFAAHQGPALTLLQRGLAGFNLQARLQLQGTLALLLDYRGALGPDLPQSDSTLHPLALSRCQAVELDGEHWKIARYGEQGEPAALASGARPASTHVLLSVDQDAVGLTRVSVDDRALWQGTLVGVRSAPGPAVNMAAGAPLGLWLAPHSHLLVQSFDLTAKPRPCALDYLGSEAILGAGGRREDWQDLKGGEYRHGLAVVSKLPAARAKWNVTGRQFTLWSPRGPRFGKAQVKLDGRVAAEIDLHADQPTPSQPLWRSRWVKDGPHAVVLNAREGLLVLDSLEVVR